MIMRRRAELDMDNPPGQIYNLEDKGFRDITLGDYIKRKEETSSSKYTQFSGNVDFYNEPKYREANLKVYQARILLQELGMTEQQAYDWIKGWLSPCDGD